MDRTASHVFREKTLYELADLANIGPLWAICRQPVNEGGRRRGLRVHV